MDTPTTIHTYVLDKGVKMCYNGGEDGITDRVRRWNEGYRIKGGTRQPADRPPATPTNEARSEDKRGSLTRTASRRD